MPGQRLPNRWLIACAGVIMNVCVGTTYAWSVFTKPLTQSEPWTQTQVTLTFTIAVAFVGLGSLLGGMWQDRKGPRLVATTAGLLYGTGFLIAAYSASNHWLWGNRRNAPPPVGSRRFSPTRMCSVSCSTIRPWQTYSPSL